MLFNDEQEISLSILFFRFKIYTTGTSSMQANSYTKMGADF